MKLSIDRPHVEAMLAAFPELTLLKEQLRFGNRAEVTVSQLSATELDFLRQLYQRAGPDMRGHVAQLATLQQALNDDGERFGEDDLELSLIHI